MSTRPCIFFILLAFNLSLAEAASAHPHASIDVTVEVNFDKAGHVTSLRQTWLFDEFYTSFALEGLPRDKAGKPDPKKLNALFIQNIKNLEPYHYYTLVESAGARIAFEKVPDVFTRMVGNRIEMTFTLPFSKPLALQRAALRYAIFDPSYYIEMLHIQAANAITLKGAPQGCSFKLEKPEPDPKAVALAYAIDQTQTGGDGLGLNFAEWVTVQCP